MLTPSGWRGLAILVAVAISTRAAVAQERLWTDASGEFSVMAELVKIDRGNVVLRQNDGKEITVPLRRLSDRDRAFIKKSQQSKRSEKPNDDGPTRVAEEFYNELRNEKRDAAVEMLTPKAKEQIKQSKTTTPLAELPTPDEGNRAIRIGRVSVDGDTAEVPVQVRAAGTTHKTKLQLRQEGDDWLVFAVVAITSDGEKTYNFEEPAAKEGASPLQALVGQPFALTGVTLDGQPIDGSQYQGKVVLVDFFATTSNPGAEMANIASNYFKYGPERFTVIGVSVDQDIDAIATFLSNQKLPWPVLVDNFGGPRNSMAARYGITSPTLILVGKDGKVVAVNCRGEALGKELGKLMAADGGGAAADKQKAVPQKPANN